MYEKLEKYFANTPRKKVLKDWEKSKQFDNIGPTVKEFLSMLKQNKGGKREGAGRKQERPTVVKTYRCYPEEVAPIKTAIKKEIAKLRKGKPKPPLNDYA
jgi:hypothetical protein